MFNDGVDQKEQKFQKSSSFLLFCEIW